MKIYIVILLGVFSVVPDYAQIAIFKVGKQKAHICVASFNNKWWDQTISKDSLINIGQLDLMGDCSDSAVICGFTMFISSNGQTNSLSSNNEYFTKNMIDRIKQSSGGAVIIQAVRYKLPNGKIVPTNDLMIYLRK